MPAIRLLIDENLTPLLAEVLSSRGYDAVSVMSAGLLEWEDRDLFEWAVRERRAILTNNAKHFAPLAEEYDQKGWEHYGVILTDQAPFRVLLARTSRLLAARSAEDLMNAVEWLHNY